MKEGEFILRAQMRTYVGFTGNVEIVVAETRETFKKGLNGVVVIGGYCKKRSVLVFYHRKGSLVRLYYFGCRFDIHVPVW